MDAISAMSILLLCGVRLRLEHMHLNVHKTRRNIKYSKD